MKRMPGSCECIRNWDSRLSINFSPWGLPALMRAPSGYAQGSTSCSERGDHRPNRRAEGHPKSRDENVGRDWRSSRIATDRVHESNLTNGQVRLDLDGKLLKSPRCMGLEEAIARWLAEPQAIKTRTPREIPRLKCNDGFYILRDDLPPQLGSPVGATQRCSRSWQNFRS